ncbi:uncharacterized protein PADG_01481 [Paracoccidioides brasiliensis Pb18]|uniref:F-box domain-containing protein n=1 Tax=Paracoccidioides brasiliensis (strain Pb18) TaxID=502780 RepID=C1G3G5_PARBD|nr:uncharacterized protein PADG_01481 [Paracoccidioides brasiliensis Pb18]EEH45331.1 hypothetical protein PADG_01481 [Paracoccidioides brasiliensis Pb18]
MVVFVNHERDAPVMTPGLHYHHLLPGVHSNVILPKHSMNPALMRLPPHLPQSDGCGMSIYEGREHYRGDRDDDKDDIDRDKGGDKWSVIKGQSRPVNRNDNNAGPANPNVNGFSAALSCYPVVVQIARSVDLNTLDSLSMTCRQFRANLLPFRSQLIRETLRCRNESLDDSPSESNNSDSPRNVRADNFQVFFQPANATSPSAGSGYRSTSAGRVGCCARDMVAECQRCAATVCRNCAVKPAGISMTRNRFRRLCSTCIAAPLSVHILPHVLSIYDHHDHNRPASPLQTQTQSQPLFTQGSFNHNSCHCEESFWLCRPCGQALRSEDTTYKRVWSWRTRYSAYLGGGLGTRIGDGCQGVKCGRGVRCLAAEEFEVEVDCEVDGWMSEDPDHHSLNTLHHNHHGGSGNGNGGGGSHSDILQHVADGHGDEEPGYLRQEIMGVGGQVKQKVKKRVKVGACVEEHEDERETDSYLKRECLGDVRSWCGWCCKVVPSRKEREG